jgi:hypothetical protein|tara:strand:+ start:2694 stop:3137 length:444 start_codon:yes stop_codon:yes gene_type:complete
LSVLRTHFITRAQKQKQKQRQRRRAHEGKDSLDRGVFCFENSRGGCPFLARETERERERESVVPKSDEESKRGVAFVLVGVPRRHREKRGRKNQEQTGLVPRGNARSDILYIFDGRAFAFDRREDGKVAIFYIEAVSEHRVGADERV